MKGKDLGMAYNVQRKADSMRRDCPDCMSAGGKCYAHGGKVENEKMHPEHEEAMPGGMREDLDAMDDDSENQSEIAKLSRGGSVMAGRRDMEGRGDVQSNAAKFLKDESIVDSVMRERRMAKGGLVDQTVHDDFETRMDFEPVHTRRDEEHDTESPSLDDESLVGQIMRERRKKRGMED